MWLLKQKWLISLIGLIAISILVWFAGPLIAIADKKILESDVVRLLIILLLLLAWGLNNLRLTAQAKSNNEKLANSLQQADSLDGSGETNAGASGEVAVLSSGFKQAMDILRRTSSSNSRYSKNYLYELPWYLLIGPPGAGKTTALVNSGLNFPLEAELGRGAVKGVAGTRNCDWWFTEQAVIIDTAGRYTTQDSHASADAKAWQGFIELLKKHRKRRPINGVLVTIGVDEILRQGEAEQAAMVNAVRARLQELTRQLGVKFPVYMVLTKCDLIPGFNAYFSMLGKEERSQVWGMTFADGAEQNQSYSQMFDAEFDVLARRLQDSLISKFHFERDLGRRAEILGFPSHFVSIKSRLTHFFERCFSESRFHDQFQLRGVYFASGTQEASGMQRVMHSMANQMGINQDALVQTGQGSNLSLAPGKSYFLRNLFQQVVFPEADLVGSNRSHENKLRIVRSTGYVASLVAAVGAAVMWSTSYGLNDSKLNLAQGQLEDYLAQRETWIGSELPQDIVPQLDPLLAMGTVFQPNQDPWSMGLGLYQGDELQKAAEQEYQSVLNGEFYQSLQAQLASQLLQHRDQPEYLHHTLKAYLMLSLPERLDKEYVSAWLRADWLNRYANQPDTLEKLDKHLQRLMPQPWRSLQMDQRLVDDSRSILRRIPLARQIYTTIKHNALQNEPTPYRFDRDFGHDMHGVFAGEFVEIPWLYTAKGYHEFFKPQQANIIEQLADDSWVVGSRGDDMSELELANIQATIEKNYLDDYVGYWQRAIDSLKLHQPASLNEHVSLLTAVLANNSAVTHVLRETSLQTQLSKPLIDPALLAENSQQVEKLASKLSPKAAKLSRIAKLAGQNRMIKLPQNPATLVDKQFEDIHNFMAMENPSASPYQRLRDSLMELQFYLESITSSGDTPRAAFEAAAQRMSNGQSDAIGKLKMEARYLPEPVKSWVLELAQRSWTHTLANGRGYLLGEYSRQVRPFYERSIQDRYPMSKQADVDITLTDFAEFFKPDGIEHSFFKQYLSPFVSTQRSPWRLKSVDGGSLGLSAQALNAFEQAHKIRRVLFSGSDTPQVSFKLTPTYLDANINRFELSALGQRLEYRHGPSRHFQLTWPSDSGNQQVKYVFEDHYGVRFGSQVEGSWAWFRFIEQQSLAKTNYSDRFTLTVNDNQRKAVYELQASSALNPFVADYLGRYQLPKRL